MRLNSTPAELRYTPRICCPYCEHSEFDIEDQAAPNETDKQIGKPPDIIKCAHDESIEREFLPYARDVGIFDPAEGKRNGKWTRVGKDFYGILNWDRFFGILHTPPGLQIYYCVARCPKCHKLIDVFVNFSKDKDTKLSKIWPHLLSKTDDGDIIKYVPQDIFTIITGNSTLLLAALITLYSISAIPLFLESGTTNFLDLLKQNFSIFLVRGIMVVTLFSICLLRNKYIGIFQKRDVFEGLFKLRDKRTLNYWLNFTVTRFTGYQRSRLKDYQIKDSCFTFNAVVLFGGLSSVIALLASWGLSHYGILTGATSHGAFPISAELFFWSIIVYCVGIVIWDFAIVPHYIFRQLENVAFDLDVAVGLTRINVFDQIGLYAGFGVFVLLVCIFLLSILPLLLAKFEEPEWVIFWAQLTLVFCYVFIIIRFLGKGGKGHSTVSPGPAILAGFLVTLYFCVKFYLTFRALELINIGESSLIKQYIELSVFFALSAYLLRLFFQLIRSKAISEIRSKQKKEALKILYENRKKFSQIKKQLEESAVSRNGINEAILFNLELQNINSELQNNSQNIRRIEEASTDSKAIQALIKIPVAMLVIALVNITLMLFKFFRN